MRVKESLPEPPTVPLYEHTYMDGTLNTWGNNRASIGMWRSWTGMKLFVDRRRAGNEEALNTYVTREFYLLRFMPLPF